MVDVDLLVNGAVLFVAARVAGLYDDGGSGRQWAGQFLEAGEQGVSHSTNETRQAFAGDAIVVIIEITIFSIEGNGRLNAG